MKGRAAEHAGRVPSPARAPAGPADPEPGAGEPEVLRAALSEFAAAAERRLGRRLRILHIGNIANNAYNNAKLMNALGFDCDVLCADYYHIMGTPEWEDADVRGDIDDQFHPCWHGVDLGGFRRPEWFVQGPMELALQYLAARRSGRRRLANRLWDELSLHNRTRPIGPRHRLRFFVRGLRQSSYRIVAFLLSPERVAHRLRGILARTRGGVLPLAGLDQGLRSMAGALRAAGEALGRGWEAQRVRAERWSERHPGRRAILRAVARGFSRARDLAAFLPPVARLKRLPVLVSLAPLSALQHIFRYILLGFIRRRLPPDLMRECEGRARELGERFRGLFPERTDGVGIEDVLQFAAHLELWERVLAHYDIVQGYACDVIYPLLAGKPFFAFEHGTLREIPYHETGLGRLTAVAYHSAEHVFVTNSDCLESAWFLAGERVTALPHPFDEERTPSAEDSGPLRRQLRMELDADVLIFHPTRQDWVVGTGFADKGNERLLRAFTRLRRAGFRVGLVAVRWGRNVGESRALLEEQGCAAHVRWCPPMCTRAYERLMQACDIVADQFILGAFGGVTFRALAAGKPVCTYLREDEVARSFGSAPRVLNCATEDEIFAVLREVLASPERLRATGEAGRRWIRSHHSGLGTVALQMRRYAEHLARHHPALARELSI